MAIASVVETWLALVWSEVQRKESSKGAVVCSLPYVVGGALAVLVRESHAYSHACFTSDREPDPQRTMLLPGGRACESQK